MSEHASLVTLTMNPALDVATAVERVVPERKLRCGPSRLDPGGGGVNVSRAIRNLGGNSLAVYPLGGPTGRAYAHFIEAEGLSSRVVPITGETRESFTVNETSTGEQFRFLLPGPTMTEAEWRACLATLVEVMPHGGLLVASGSLPPGAPEDFYARVARAAVERSVRPVIDASGSALAHALEAGVFLIKPSRDELAQLIGAGDELHESEMVDAARSIVAEGRSQLVALTMGRRGAVLVSRDHLLRLPSPHVEVASPVGAGDAFLGGLVLRLAQGRTLTDAFRTAVAAGSATAMLPATQLCRADDVARFEADPEWR